MFSGARAQNSRRPLNNGTRNCGATSVWEAALFFKVAAAVFFLLFVVLLPRAADADFYISKAGKALTPIVVPDNAGISEKYAAETLKKYLDDISGANFKIVSASNAKDAVPSIQIGDTPKALKHLSKFDSHKAPYDSIVIKTSDGALFLNGHRKRGAVYAVSEFLQRVLGVRQWSADRSFIPKNPDIALGNLDIFYAPRLISRRSSYLEPMLNPDFAAFMKALALFQKKPG